MEQSARGSFSLVVQEVQDDDGGQYTCEALNDAGSCQVTVEIIVEGKASPWWAWGLSRVGALERSGKRIHVRIIKLYMP